MVQQLWVSGFNAWGQLSFEENSELPKDVYAFKCILEDESIQVLKTTLSATVVRTSKGIRVAGYPDHITELFSEDPAGISRLAIAGNGKIVEDLGNIIKEYESLSDYLESQGTSHYEVEEIAQIVAGQTSFTALSATGQVWTWGDARYESSLGREASEQHPASTPCLVEDLSDLPTGPIRKVSAGGYLAAALTIGNDLYLWGGRAGQPKILECLTGEPTPFDLDGDDVLDVSVGDNHALALSTDHKIFVAGNGGNGQLGMEDREKIEEWTEVVFPLKDNQRAISVHAGYKNSFVLIENIT